MRILDQNFFKTDVNILAEKLLGKILCRKIDGEILRFRITEVECYGGPEDSASHAFKGKTKRNTPMFECGGTIYVYFCYGIHEILNIVSSVEGNPQGVMIRGVKDLFGPGKVTKALKVNRSLSGQDITKSNDLWLEDDGLVAENIQRFKRVGIGYATQEDQDKLWRLRINQG